MWDYRGTYELARRITIYLAGSFRENAGALSEFPFLGLGIWHKDTGGLQQPLLRLCIVALWYDDDDDDYSVCVYK